MKKQNGFLLIEQLFALVLIILCASMFVGLFVISERSLNDVKVDNQLLAVMLQQLGEATESKGVMQIDKQDYRWQINKIGAQWQIEVENGTVRWTGTEQKVEKEWLHTR
ncbi:type II secretion system protein [Brochothrix thermosphacta]|uniref:Type II secretion system protein n=1 Tax=Brochothrix thermosphacta TaxID=2756 RepID=A0A1D2LTH0_BROTH|nr:type II secretion system protein [Brochothrix thermosphacta]ATF25214.1 hypothetical protein CNY62_01770 [Brochothrix thermosphacta]ATH84597.1 hypothetical protein CPF12_01600 [Brochothrix thermosphacta]EUJ38510.1 hypothetical protein BTHER_01305 [Brochothrix thermosphacta DSM 20171 = FSL F6-1036]MPQ27647.1 type II secretion system protein [Brochothrix thermosphacta]ODJ47971.1 hypothetical protein BFR34_10645 [Brochothrix thermosphacta DSM 20171 = FSL F6-1036]